MVEVNLSKRRWTAFQGRKQVTNSHCNVIVFNINRIVSLHCFIAIIIIATVEEFVVIHLVFSILSNKLSGNGRAGIARNGYTYSLGRDLRFIGPRIDGEPGGSSVVMRSPTTVFMAYFLISVRSRWFLTLSAAAPWCSKLTISPTSQPVELPRLDWGITMVDHITHKMSRARFSGGIENGMTTSTLETPTSDGNRKNQSWSRKAVRIYNRKRSHPRKVRRHPEHVFIRCERLRDFLLTLSSLDLPHSAINWDLSEEVVLHQAWRS